MLGTRRPCNLPGIAHRTFQTPGIADLWVFLPPPRLAVGGPAAPRFLWHEVKADDGAPSTAQRLFEARCHARDIPHLLGGVDALRVFLIRHGFLKEGGV